MLYPIAIEPGDETHAFGVIVPDIPGCFSAGDTLEEAYANAKEAIKGHLELLVEMGEEVPLPTSIDNHRKNPDFTEYDMFFGVVDVDITHLLGKAEKSISQCRHISSNVLMNLLPPIKSIRAVAVSWLKLLRIKF